MSKLIKAKQKEFYFGKGESFQDTITIVDYNTNSAIDITGTSISGSYREAFTRANAELAFEFAEHDAANGVWNIAITAANTATSNTGRFDYTIYWTDANSSVHRAQHGVVVVYPI